MTEQEVGERGRKESDRKGEKGRYYIWLEKVC